MLAQSAKEHEDIKVKLERANKQVSCLLKKEREKESGACTVYVVLNHSIILIFFLLCLSIFAFFLIVG